MKIPMPSPRGTNHARLFIDVPHARLAMDAMPAWSKASVYRRIARDDFEPPKDDVSASLTDVLNFLKTAMQPDQYQKAELLIGKTMQLSRQRIADHHKEVNQAASANGEATDDNDTAEGAYPPKVTGSLSMDSARPWRLRPDNASGDARGRLLANMKRIGHA